eukprot:2830709-Amphidinium_carterae.1
MMPAIRHIPSSETLLGVSFAKGSAAESDLVNASCQKSVLPTRRIPGLNHHQKYARNINHIVPKSAKRFLGLCFISFAKLMRVRSAVHAQRAHKREPQTVDRPRHDNASKHVSTKLCKWIAVPSAIALSTPNVCQLTSGLDWDIFAQQCYHCTQGICLRRYG